jgi:hypothetical protein
MPEMTRDFNSLYYITPLLATAVRAGAAAESNGTAKKTHGCRSGAFLVEIGNIEAAGTIYLTFQHSADNSTWEDLTPIGYSSANITITDAAALGENNIIAFAVDELYEGGYVRVQHYNTNTHTLTGYGVQFIGFRALNRPIFKKWAIGETYLLGQIVQNDGYYFKNILAFGATLADAEKTLGTSVSEPGVGASTATYWQLYKGV